MKEEVFAEVVAQAGAESCFIPLPQGFGETFLRPRWADFLGMSETEGEVVAFLERWRERVGPSDLVLINEYNDWAGKGDDRRVAESRALSQDARVPCRMLWRNLSVQADGRVSACCHDSEAELIVGDLRAGESLGEIWRGEKLRRLRTIHGEGRLEELPICAGCWN
jgi:radical SAM protein with 4Fe4S-binding SPASM domain